jgi:dUTP pyrophosphatase
MITSVKVKQLNDLATIPTRGSKEAAGYDLYAAIENEIDIAPQSTIKIPTGLSFDFPSGMFGAIVARSGIATKRGLRLSNCVGIIDSDYRGEVIVALYNDTDEIQSIEPKERIAQLILMPYVQMMFCETATLSETTRGENGFGSTGK